MPRTVRFHEIGDASVLRLEEEPLQDPGPGQVRLRVEALGFMFADSLFRTGQYPEKATLPGAGIGYEAAGIVDAVGPGVSEFREAIGSRASRTSRSWISPCIARAPCFPRGA
jgi:NADPH:quinone reductase